MDTETVHLIEDDDSMRTALSRVLEAAGYATRGYASAVEFLMACHDAADCVVLDVGLPGLNGIELQRTLNERRDPAPIVFITGRGDIPTSVRAMKAGAVDFLTKPVDRRALLRAVESAVERGRERREREMRRREAAARYERLTAREREVFDRVVVGRLNKQVADELGTTVRTIKAHRAQVMAKMEARTLTELLAAARELDPPD